MNGRVADSMLVNTALMLIYITKFFWWESGYWCTMDIAHDRGIQLYYGFKCNCFLTKSYMIILSTSYLFTENSACMFNLFHIDNFSS
jgi:hypothetical protein